MPIPDTSRQLLQKTLGQGEETQVQRTAFDQSARAASGSQGTQPSFADTLDEAQANLKQAYGNLAREKQKLMTEKTKLELRKEIMSNSAIQELIKMRGELTRKATGTSTKIEGKADVNPLAQGKLKGGDISSLVGAMSDVSGDIETRGAGVKTVIDAITRQQQQDLEGAKTEFDAAKGVLGAQLDVSAEGRQQALLPGQLENQNLQNTRLGQQISGTEPLTAEQILKVGETFANPEAVLSFLQNRQQSGSINRPQRNLNPLNLKVSPFTQKFVDNGMATVDPVPATDGGYFLKFNDLGAAITASKNLLFEGANYKNLSVDAALRRWSGKGYGAEIVKGVPAGKAMKDLTVQEEAAIIKAMMAREGFTAGASKQQLSDIFAPRTEGKPADFGVINQIVDNIRQDPDIANFRKVNNSLSNILSASQQNSGVGDLTLLREYAKLVDPNTGVREEEFASMASAQGALAARGVQLSQGMINGKRLTPGARADFVRNAQNVFQQYKVNYDTALQRASLQSQSAGVNPELVLPKLLNEGMKTAPQGQAKEGVTSSGLKYKIIP